MTGVFKFSLWILLALTSCQSAPFLSPSPRSSSLAPSLFRRRHHTKLHFSHPLIAESPSPDTKVRTDYFFADQPPVPLDSPTKRHTLRLEGEYAFTHWMSLEVDLPYTSLDTDSGPTATHIDTARIAVKMANFAFAEQGILVGGGLELGLPTGRDRKGIGSNHEIEVEPFLDFGWHHGDLEVVGFTSFGLPTNENGQDETDLAFSWNLSTLYHLTPRLEVLFELDGEHDYGGEADGLDLVHVTPGIKLQPFADPALQIGAGVSLPLSDDRDFYVMPVLSFFYHF